MLWKDGGVNRTRAKPLYDVPSGGGTGRGWDKEGVGQGGDGTGRGWDREVWDKEGVGQGGGIPPPQIEAKWKS